MPAPIDVNGMHHDFGSIELGLNGLYLPGVKSINYRSPHTVGKIRGMSAHLTGRTRGTEDAEGDIEIYSKYWKIVLAMLGDDWAAQSNPIKVSYWEAASEEDTMVDTLPGVRLISPDRGHAEGPEGLTVKLTLDILGAIKWDGRHALSPR